MDFYTWRDHVTFYRLFKGMEFSREIISKAQLGAQLLLERRNNARDKIRAPLSGRELNYANSPLSHPVHSAVPKFSMITSHHSAI